MRENDELRKRIRTREITGQTSGLARGFAQANLVILHKRYAFDFLLFCIRNPKSCPLLDVCEAGEINPNKLSIDADIRTDIPKYRILKDGVLIEEVTDCLKYFNEDSVSFLIGCSFTFEDALIKNGVPIRHIDENKNVPMYITNIECTEAGIFSGPTVVSMRPMSKDLIQKAIDVTSEYPSVHGAPLKIGNYEELGISDINKPDFGDAVTIREGEIPVFWACGVTPQAAIMRARPDLVITHSPGHMFITDIRDEELKSL